MTKAASLIHEVDPRLTRVTPVDKRVRQVQRLKVLGRRRERRAYAVTEAGPRHSLGRQLIHCMQQHRLCACAVRSESYLSWLSALVDSRRMQ